MARPRRSSASPARGATAARPSRRLAKAVHRRAVAVSEKLASRGLGAFVWRKKLDRDLSRGLVPGIVSARAERRRCLARRKEAGAVKASRRASPPPLPLPAASCAEADAKEAAFLLEQSRRRAAIRFAENRPARVDVLVASLDGTRRRALVAFRGASADELKALREEIGAQAELDKANAPFWEAAKVVCDAEIIVKSEAAWRGERFLHCEVAADVESVVGGKSFEELDAMLQAIEARIAAGEDNIVEHWLEVAQLIRVEKARKLLAQNYSTCDDDDHAPPPLSLDANMDTQREIDHRIAEADDEDGSELLCPVALPAAQEGQHGWRKPKYVARVMTGYEWNKYNRAHYDRDHPPPKAVRGYRFVLYYPDLAAGGSPPQYTVEEDVGCGQTCIVRFRAGWPYEDVAFRVVNRDWERSRKAGFRCTFDGGVLRLCFNFKRFFYRR